ncbi:hypothetical protein N7495_007018 [Penicillium taxi]|uniref:uncharacterized protein n=1 Tax=Penicillium taxi TaxID=168475 RepID=UPI002545687B|nr:uncharacterized protein N7495_007018 [Penicillium taxi]KAJ5895327.1 hypothetical protein N7495_007018 [Penicillium taxi]
MVAAQLHDIKDALALTTLTCRSLAIRFEPEFCYRARNHICKLEKSVLEWAATRGEVRLTRKLLKDNKAISSDTKDLALCKVSSRYVDDLISENESLEVAKILLENGASARTGRDLDIFTALHHAAGNFESIVKLLLDHGADANDQMNADGRAPLHCAVQDTKSIVEFEPIMKLLLAKGADINSKDSHERTILYDAVRLRGSKYTKMLLAYGASVYSRTEGFTPLHYSTRNCATMLLLLNSGADINARDDHGYTALHLAIGESREDSMRLLLNTGADIHARTDKGYTPLHIAASISPFDTPEKVRLLLEKGADIKLQDNDGLTPLHWAAKHGLENALKLLLRAGADTEAKDSHQFTPLHLAVISGKPEAAQLLLRSGAEVMPRDDDGSTPLHFAAEAMIASASNVKTLLDHGADVMSRNRAGFTPLHLAVVEANNEDAVRTLLEAGALHFVGTNEDIDVTPLAFARRRADRRPGFETIVSLLENACEKETSGRCQVN